METSVQKLIEGLKRATREGELLWAHSTQRVEVSDFGGWFTSHRGVSTIVEDSYKAEWMGKQFTIVGKELRLSVAGTGEVLLARGDDVGSLVEIITTDQANSLAEEILEL